MRVLVLEGGGMRGVYSAGVLEAFSETDAGRGLRFDFVVACSAGACVAASYLAGQPRRNRQVYLDFLDGDKLVRFRRLATGGSVMDIDYLAFEVTLRLCPLDHRSAPAVGDPALHRSHRLRNGGEPISHEPRGRPGHGNPGHLFASVFLAERSFLPGDGSTSTEASPIPVPGRESDRARSDGSGPGADEPD